MENVEKILARIDQTKYEIELRFGTFYGQRFESTVPAKDFYRILAFFTDNNRFNYQQQSISERTKQYGVAVPEKPDQLVEEIYTTVPAAPAVDCTGESKIRKQWIPVAGAPVFYNSKRKCHQIDLHDVNARVSIAEETDLQPSDDILLNLKYVKPSAIREKSRWSFTTTDTSHPFYNFSVDLTVTKTTAQQRDKIAYEVELELLRPVNNIQTQFNNAIYNMLMLLQDTNHPLNTKDISTVIQAYNKLFTADLATAKRKLNPYWNLYNVINKPIDLDLNNLLEANSLAVTDKADGQRRLLYFNNNYGYLVFPPKTVSLYLLPDAGLQRINNVLLDGELITENGKRVYLAFDLLVLNGRDIRNEQFAQRIKKLDQFISGHNLSTVRVKKFYFPTPESDFYANVNKVLAEIPTKSYENDGLVFNNVYENYQKATILKWKPLEQLTIDFKVIQIAPGKFELQVIDNGKYIKFTGTKKYPVNAEIYSTEISDGQIVEMTWDGSFRVYRVRYDRETPNGIIPARNVWYHINNPITEKTIRGHDLVVMRRYHNVIKRDMIKKYCKKSVMLDIGSGKGGDISKWIDAEATVLAVEPFQTHLNEMINRLRKDGFQQKNNVYSKGTTDITVVQGYGEDTESIMKHFAKIADRAQCITIFNALTFFYIDEQRLNALIATISNLLADGGYFMGIVMDGQLVRRAFTQRNTKVLQNYGWKIQKESQFTNSPYGNKIIIDLEAATVSNQTEYLVDFNVLVQKLEQHGIYLVKDVSYHLSNPNLSHSQQELNNLYRKFVFVRQKTVARAIPEPRGAIVEYTDTDNPFKMLPNQITTLLAPEQSEPVKLVDYDFYRIGVISNHGYLLAAILRAVQGHKLTTAELNTAFNNFIKNLEEDYHARRLVTVMEYYPTWEDAKDALLIGQNWQWLDLWQPLAFHFETNLIVITSDTYVSKITEQVDVSGIDKTVYLYQHDGVFDVLAWVDEHKQLQTIF